MSPAVWIGVSFLGGIGAMGRFLLDVFVTSRASGGFPLGTLAVNVSGAFVLGLLAGATLDDSASLLAGTAAIGSYTTFSTWMLESQRLGEEGEVSSLAANIIVSGAVGVAAAALGRAIGRHL